MVPPLSRCTLAEVSLDLLDKKTEGRPTELKNGLESKSNIGFLILQDYSKAHDTLKEAENFTHSLLGEQNKGKM